MQKLVGLKTVGLGGLRATFEGSLFMFWGAKFFLKNIVGSALKSVIK